MKDKELDTVEQSKAAYGQWAPQWRAHAKAHAKYKMRPLSDFNHIGLGKVLLLCANGYSLEEHMPVIQAYMKHNPSNLDIMACDKSLGHLIRHGIKPKFCLVCDANVNYEKYLKPYESELSDTVLLINVCANPEWSANGNWKDRYFFVNEDVMNYEREFMQLSGCQNKIIAGTNVSNAMVIMATQCTNGNPQNMFGYDLMLLSGFDYCWLPGRYYAFDHEAGGKDNYMRHIVTLFRDTRVGYSSQNLTFSEKWLSRYVKAFGLKVFNCSKASILSVPFKDLSEGLTYSFRPEDCGIFKSLLAKRTQALMQVRQLDAAINEVIDSHHDAARAH